MDVIAIGDNISDCYLSLGQVFPGGNAVNVAVAAARAAAGTSAWSATTRAASCSSTR
jgi:sugar/nucleoside kinase (ribokinase family)